MKQTKLLNDVKGIKKSRNLLILSALSEGGQQVAVAKQFNLNKSTISRIASKNKELLDHLTFNASFASKAGRLRIAFQEIQRKIGTSKKDLIDCLEYVRKEIEGDKAFFEQYINVSQKKEVNFENMSKKELSEFLRRELSK